MRPDLPSSNTPHSPDRAAQPPRNARSASGEADSIVWIGQNGKPISCLEKIKVLNQNFAEWEQITQDALDDAVVMGADPELFKSLLAQALTRMRNIYE